MKDCNPSKKIYHKMKENLTQCHYHEYLGTHKQTNKQYKQYTKTCLLLYDDIKTLNKRKPF